LLIHLQCIGKKYLKSPSRSWSIVPQRQSQVFVAVALLSILLLTACYCLSARVYERMEAHSDSSVQNWALTQTIAVINAVNLEAQAEHSGAAGRLFVPQYSLPHIRGLHEQESRLVRFLRLLDPISSTDLSGPRSGV
jgi:hypothetical protein